MTNLTNRHAAGRLLRAGALGALLAGTAACDLDLINPNAPAEDEVLGSAELVLTTAVGIQNQYAENVLVFVRAPALASDEWGTRQRALAADQSLVTGQVDPGFGVVTDPFSAAYRIARTADVLIEAAPRVGLTSGTQVGVTAMSRLLKAMALGNLTLQYERMPANYDPEGALPQPRAEVRDTVIALLETARAELGTVSDADLAGFRASVLGTPGLDLRNTVNAMLARYYLFDGQYQQAITAAQRVNLGVLSVLTYPNPGVNPIYNYGFPLDYVGTRKSFFTGAVAGDQRVGYWATRTGGAVGLPDSVFAFRKYSGRNDAFPLYLPDEMRLIQAEAYARLGQLDQARTQINAVRTQCSSTVDEPVACMAALPVEALDTPAEVFAEILYQRRYELYAQGLRWEDLRRLNEFTTIRPSIQFLPYPQQECDRNPARPCA